jgi:DnaJ family protein A protein 2
LYEAIFGQKGKIIPKKTKSVIHPVKCTLEDLYSGKTFKIKVTRDRLCKDCDAKGGSKENA